MYCLCSERFYFLELSESDDSCAAYISLLGIIPLKVRFAEVAFTVMRKVPRRVMLWFEKK